MPKKEKTMSVVVAPKEREVAGFIEQAIKSNLPVETMEKLFALQRQVKADVAKEAFVSAMSKFQSEVPVIEKTRKVLNKDGRSVRYQYAPLEEIVKQIRDSLAKNGLSYTWEVENKEGFIKAVAKVTHVFGHSETSQFEIPIDKEGFMTAPQKYASALTFAKRYSLCNALGITTAEEDTDATDVEKQPEVKSVRSRIVLALRALGYESNGWDEKTWSENITKLTQLDLKEKDLPEIAIRLEILVKEKSDDNSKV